MNDVNNDVTNQTEQFKNIQSGTWLFLYMFLMHTGVLVGILIQYHLSEAILFNKLFFYSITGLWRHKMASSKKHVVMNFS